jgi:WhiB family redox-sensing transcriptional regulator
VFAEEQVTENEGIDWDRAACRGADALTEVFFSEQLADIAAAKAICADCVLARPCLSGALARREPWGVWGGQLFLNGKVLAQKRKRGRPPKIRRDEVEFEVQSA